MSSQSAAAASSSSSLATPSPRCGVYLNLPHADYLSDPALGSSGLKELAYNPALYWFNSPLNPHYVPDCSTKAQVVGTAFHTMALEGPKAFHDRFIMEPGPAYMRTVAELNFFLTEREAKQQKLKADAIKAVLALDPAAKIYDVAVAAATDAGKQILKEDDYVRIVRASEAILANPALAPAIAGEGRSEVSVFWTEEVDGVPIRLKARFDRLKPRAVIDLKSTRPTFGRSFDQECRRAIVNYRYDLQAYHYLKARAKFAEHWAAGRVAGLPDNDGQAGKAATWARACAEADAYAFVFIFWANDGAPLTWGGSLSPDNPIFEISGRDRDHALRAYARCVKQFEPGQPWLEYDNLGEIFIEDLPAWFGR